MNENRYSATKLADFFNYVISKGLMNKGTANSRKIASAKILESLDAQEINDLRDLNREEAFQRFVNLRGKDYSPQSLSVYKSRFISALDDFLTWVEDPVNFRPSGASRQTRQTKKPLTKLTDSESPSPEQQIAPAEPQSSDAGLTDLLNLPIPLRKGVIVKIHGLPNDLTQDEANKIAAIVSAYAAPITEKPN